MDRLESSRTFENLVKTFSDESRLALRYLFYAVGADFEGLARHAELFREMAEGGMTNAHGTFDYLRLIKDPDSGIPVGSTLKNLESLIQTETRQFSQEYPEMARIAREEGFSDIASWFDTLEKLKRLHAARLAKLGPTAPETEAHGDAH